MKKIFILTSLFSYLFLGCAASTDLHNEYIEKISSKYFMYNNYVVIPVKLSNNSELVITNIWSVFDNIFRVYREDRYHSFTRFLKDLLNNKFIIPLEQYNLTDYTIVETTEVYEEYTKSGIKFILNKYFKEYGLTKDEPIKYRLKFENPPPEESDLIRIMFDNQFFMGDDDISGCIAFVKFDK